jgi:outer membrane protein TolC
MKSLFLIIAFLTVSCMAYTQQSLSLEECIDKAIENYPLLKQKQLFDDVYQLTEKNLKTKWLPGLNAGARASYQSDVVEISADLPFPADFPSPSKDQYSTYLDVNQMIYDGGITKQQQQLAMLESQLDQKNVDVELHKLKEQVTHVYFTILLLNENIDITKIMHEELQKRIEIAKSSVKNGVLLKSELQNLKAESLAVQQNLAELKADVNATRNILITYIGAYQEDSVLLEKPILVIPDTLNNARPEKDLFDINQSVLNTNKELLMAQRRPKLSAFGQLGYGRPGLNLTSDQFDTYYLVGATLSWNVLDWNKNNRERQILDINKEVIETNEKTFDKNITIALQRHEAAIEKLQQMIQMDDEIVELHEDVVKTAASQLDNGVITSVDYLSKLNEANRAKNKKALHTIQLLQAYSTYKLLLGH